MWLAHPGPRCPTQQLREVAAWLEVLATSAWHAPEFSMQWQLLGFPVGIRGMLTRSHCASQSWVQARPSRAAGAGQGRRSSDRDVWPCAELSPWRALLKDWGEGEMIEGSQRRREGL